MEDFLKNLNHEKQVSLLRDYMKSRGLDAFWITSFDQFLSEYTPLIESHRFWYTGFTGSIAEVLIDHEDVFLFVDGRYYEQADRECPKLSVVKVPYGTDLPQAFRQKILDKSYTTLGYEPERTSLNEMEKLPAVLKTVASPEAELAVLMDYRWLEALAPVKELPLKLTGEGRLEKWQKILDSTTGLFVSQLDSVSWLLNARGYHRLKQSTIKGMILVTREKALVLLDPGTPLDSCWSKIPEVEFVFVTLANTKAVSEKIEAFKTKQKIQRVRCFKSGLTVAQADLLKDLWPNLVEFSELAPWSMHYKKTSAELSEFESSFLKASQVISRSLSNTAKDLVKGTALSEACVRERLEADYTASGALGLSFSTIAGVGANSSVIHFSQSSKQREIKESEIILVDSGVYYEAGLATDTTRTFLSFGEALPWQKEIYTLVLKGLIQVSKARFPVGTWGAQADALARAPIREAGFDYSHGTGHGVGILVHEGGYRLTPTSTMPLVPGVVGSLEPGIYLPGKGGVRLENVVIVELCPDDSKMVQFRPLTWVGFDHRLINHAWLDPKEMEWLKNYEGECARLGTLFVAS